MEMNAGITETLTSPVSLASELLDAGKKRKVSLGVDRYTEEYESVSFEVLQKAFHCLHEETRKKGSSANKIFRSRVKTVADNLAQFPEIHLTRRSSLKLELLIRHETSDAQTDMVLMSEW